MKPVNYASLDPLHAARGVRGLKNVSRKDRDLWRRFEEDPDTVLHEAIEAAQNAGSVESVEELPPFQSAVDLPAGPETKWMPVEVRRQQGFFRKAVLASYGDRCALTGLAMPSLLTASHIRPWAESSRAGRLDPRNGIALNALYDRAFDRGLFTLDYDLKVVVSSDLPDKHPLFGISGRKLTTPERFAPAQEYLASHHENWGFRL